MSVCLIMSFSKLGQALEMVSEVSMAVHCTYVFSVMQDFWFNNVQASVSLYVIDTVNRYEDCRNLVNSYWLCMYWAQPTVTRASLFYSLVFSRVLWAEDLQSSTVGLDFPHIISCAGLTFELFGKQSQCPAVFAGLGLVSLSYVNMHLDLKAAG